mmetsp:Transcript_9573/g.19541  ORF Transcript_9573/g.19541 Transcript_9573/m.19541 type:complete len:150 (-) Transcript_9573:60-509(-)
MSDQTDAAQRRHRHGAKTGLLTVSLIWDTPCNLNLHLYGGPHDLHIWQGNPAGGGAICDVTMNRSGEKVVPQGALENIFFKDVPQSGVYVLRVDNFESRKRGPTHFEMVIDFDGKSVAFEAQAMPSPPNEQMVTVAAIEVGQECGLGWP